MTTNKKTPFLPFAIPKLESRNMRIGKEGLMRRFFPEGSDGFFRIYEEDHLSLAVEFQQEEPRALVHLYTNLDGPSDVWRELEFSKNEDGVHRLSCQAKQRGDYQFKIKYSLDGGKSWYWDRLPFSRVIVDPVSLKDIRMYTMIPTVSGVIKDWIDMLDGIADLGFNAVHLLPLTELDRSESPYSARDLFAIEATYREYNDPTGFVDFERFIHKAKDRGIRLCFDLTLNHIGVGSRMVRECPEWIVPDRTEKDGMKRAGCWHMNTWLTWKDLVKINYDHPHPEIQRDIWDYMTNYSLFWAHFAGLTDGMVRLDNLHSSHEGFISYLLKELRRNCPNVIVMAEFFTDSNTILKKAADWHIDLFLANSWEYPYAEDLRTYIRYIHDIGRQVRYIIPVTTHDTGAPAQLFGAPEAAVPRYAVTALMGAGRTGIVQGTEYGYPEKIDFIGRKGRIRFNDNPTIRERLRSINTLFAGEDLFHHEGNIDFIDNDHGAVLGVLRRSGQADREGFLVFANLDVKNGYALDIDLSSLLDHEGDLIIEDTRSGVVESVSSRGFVITVDPCDVRIFRCRVPS